MRLRGTLLIPSRELAMTNEKNHVCTECRVGTLEASTYSDNFNHGKGTLRVEGLECYICNSCGADPVLVDQIRRNQLRIADAKRAADGHLLGAEVRYVRMRLGLTQQEASALFGGGANAFSKYERGDTLQSEAMDCLLRLVGRHPFLLKDLEQEQRLIGPIKFLQQEFSWHDIDVLDMPAESYSDVRDLVTVADSSYSDWQIAA